MTTGGRSASVGLCSPRARALGARQRPTSTRVPEQAEDDLGHLQLFAAN
ncbi:MAG TPA: hypothetical protein VMU75_13295 [Acidimicrobiales bacterium]|nr:hypothetical protein [Acidimicrobiales bacterium]